MCGGGDGGGGAGGGGKQGKRSRRPLLDTERVPPALSPPSTVWRAHLHLTDNTAPSLAFYILLGRWHARNAERTAGKRGWREMLFLSTWKIVGGLSIRAKDFIYRRVGAANHASFLA